MKLNNNLKISFRRLKADKTNTLISISGLILGLGIVAVVLVYITNELNYDSSFANNKNIYRVINFNENDNHTWANTPFVIAEMAKDRFAEVEDFTHQYNIENIEVEKTNTFISEPDMMCVESNFFKIFGVQILKGSLADFDKTEDKILLSQKMARKYFGSEYAVGKPLKIRYNGQESTMEVAAIYKDFPQNTSIKASLIGSIDFGLKHLADNITPVVEEQGEIKYSEAWEGVFFTNYLLLKDKADIPGLEAKLKQLGKENSNDNNKFSLSLQPLKDIYFRSETIVDNNSKEKGNMSMLIVLGFIGGLILVIACMNYLNLTAAKTMSQVKTFAVRKVCGASQKSIVGQMVFDSLLVSLLAFPFALMAAHYSLPVISEMLGKTYTIEISNKISLCILILLTMATGILSGVLTSTHSVRFGLANVLKGNKLQNSNKHYARNGMVIFQIAIFISLATTMLMVQKQVRYAFNKELGFAKEGLIRVTLGDQNLELYKQEIGKNPNVLSASGTLWMPPSDNKMYMSIPKVSNPDELVKVNGLFVDYGFAETMGMRIVMGADFDKEKNNNGVLVNEAAIKTLGLTDVLGEETAFGTVVGVVSNFNMHSLHEAISPMIIGLNPGMAQNIAIRLRTENLKKTIADLKSVWAKTGATSTFDYEFTDDILGEMYSSDIKFSKIIGLLAGVAIFIASLGLFGLSLLMSKERIKEIGIRKINGAKISEIMTLLNGNFVKWVGIAFLAAIPVSYYAIHKWLENFAYKTELSWWIFVLAGLLALGVALLTVSWQSWRAATRNPVEALRYE